MPDDISTHLGLPYLLPGQAQKHVTHNEALWRLDLVVQLAVATRTLAAPPALPAEGDRHIVGPGASGDWAGQEGRIAVFEAGAWVFVVPRPGWRAHVLAEGLTLIHDGSAWADGPGRLGINTAPDAVNRLAVSAAATLLSHAGAGHQLKINKAAPAETASLLLQSGWSGRAEIGLAGGDDLAVKVSADGATWTEALAVAAATGLVSLPQGAQVGGAITGTAVTQSALDTTAGRLLKVGDFGLGSAGATVPGNDVSSITVPGNYQITAAVVSGSAALSGIATSGSGFLHLAFDANSAAQIMIHRTTGVVWARTKSVGTWGAFRPLYGTGNLLGTVSQAAGSPTGAVIERGANANGEFVRFADGTQICTRALAGSTTAATTWTFPAAFAVAPVVSGAVQATVLSALCLEAAPGTTSAGFSLRSKTDARRADTVHLTATGRWF